MAYPTYCSSAAADQRARWQEQRNLPASDPRNPGHPLAPYLAAGSAMLVKTATSTHALPTKREIAARQAQKADVAQRQAERKSAHALVLIMSALCCRPSVSNGVRNITQPHGPAAPQGPYRCSSYDWLLGQGRATVVVAAQACPGLSSLQRPRPRASLRRSREHQ